MLSVGFWELNVLGSLVMFRALLNFLCLTGLQLESLKRWKLGIRMHRHARLLLPLCLFCSTLNLNFWVKPAMRKELDICRRLSSTISILRPLRILPLRFSAQHHAIICPLKRVRMQGRLFLLLVTLKMQYFYFQKCSNYGVMARHTSSVQERKECSVSAKGPLSKWNALSVLSVSLCSERTPIHGSITLHTTLGVLKKKMILDFLVKETVYNFVLCVPNQSCLMLLLGYWSAINLLCHICECS